MEKYKGEKNGSLGFFLDSALARQEPFSILFEACENGINVRGEHNQIMTGEV